MLVITHALAPVVLAKLTERSAQWRGRWGLLGIGVFGALPDLLTPHISIDARMHSWSHGLPFWLALSAALLLVASCSRGRLSIRLAAICSAAYLLHLICDAISGGINWLYPVRNFIWGDYWVPFRFWFPLDLLCVSLGYLIFRIWPALRAKFRNPAAN